MKLSNFIEGLKILQPYYKDGDGYHIGAEHDQFYADQTERPLTAKDVQRMIDLGWHQEYDERDYEQDFAVEHYRADEGWTAYT